MKFYQIEDQLAARIAECRIPVRVQIAIDFTGAGTYEPIPETDILELTVTSLRETTGGTVNKGTLILDNTTGSWCPRVFDTYRPAYNKYNGEIQSDGLGNLRPGREVRISFTCGKDIPYVKRFTFYVDNSGFQQTATGYTGRVCTVNLVDLSETLKNTDRTKNWKENAVLVHSNICDKEFPGTSIVHQIAARAGLSASDIDCSTIREYVAYVKLTRSAWTELSELAATYNAHLEAACEKPLVFVESTDPVQYTFDHTNATHIRMFDLTAQYRNCIRMRWTRYGEYERQELWRYADPPILYTANLTPTFPFVTEGEKRDIEKAGYEATYTVRPPGGKPIPVVYAENIDTPAQFEARLRVNGPALEVETYDVTTNRDKAVIRLNAPADTVLLSATIHGDAIAAEHNFSHYLSDDAEIEANGTQAVNITSPYLSETYRDGKPYYAMYARRLLDKLKRKRKGFFVKTHRGLFHARVGSFVRIALADGLVSERAEIVQMELRYRAREAFVATFFLEE